MTADRIDELLEEALATGAVPDHASASERAEVKRLLEARGLLQTVAAGVGEEAESSRSTARARFQRYVAVNSAEAAPRRRLLPWGRLAPHRMTMALAGSAVSVAMIAIAAVIAWQLTGNSTPSAYAEMVEPGDYVQIEGVVGDATGGELELESALGNVDVELGSATVMGADAAHGAGSLRRGDRVLVSGIAGGGGRLVAQTVALGADGDERPPRVINLRQLRRLQASLEGEVISYTISSDGSRGAVLLEASDGSRYLVPVDGESATRLLEEASTALGQRVTVVEASGTTPGTFTLDLPSSQGEGHAGELVNVRGVIAAAAIAPQPTGGGVPDVLLTVQTVRGPVEVRVPEDARSFLGASDLPAGPRLLIRAVGHTVSVTGGRDAGTGQVVADALVLGPRAERPGR
jgi:hypothetical protein